MPDRDGGLRLEVRHLGCLAARALDRGGAGRIGALFERTFYLDLGEVWICVGADTLGRGPLNLGCALPGSVDWHASGLREGLDCHAGPSALRIGQLYRLALGDAEVWSPPPGPPWSFGTLVRGLEHLEDLAARRLPEEGLACFLIADGRHDGTRVAARAKEAITEMTRWLSAAAQGGSRRRDLPPLSDLIGLGPGLTPSGDDFLGGVLIALHLLGLENEAMRLYDAALPQFRSNRNPISTAHFRAAAEGAASAVLHDALVAATLGRREALEAALAEVDGIGHTSGWDCLAGIVVALRAAVEPSAAVPLAAQT